MARFNHHNDNSGDNRGGKGNGNGNYRNNHQSGQNRNDNSHGQSRNNHQYEQNRNNNSHGQNRNNNSHGQNRDNYQNEHNQNNNQSGQYRNSSNGNHNGNNYQNNTKKKRGNNQGNNNDQNRPIYTESKSRQPCEKCWLSNHPTDRCKTQPPLEGDRCTCGNLLHTKYKCPWNGDRAKVPPSLTMAQEKTLICKWCKGSGTTHTELSCPHKKQFHTDAWTKIQAAYEKFNFCAHCSSTQHKTRGCPESARTQKEHTWESKLTSWQTNWEQSEGEDMAPPDLSPYTWCYFCENFATTEEDHPSPRTCPDSATKTQFMNLVPVHLREKFMQEPVAKRTFGPQGAISFNGGFGSNNNGCRLPDIMEVTCSTCRLGKVEFMRSLIREQKQCPKCNWVIEHPNKSLNPVSGAIEPEPRPGPFFMDNRSSSNKTFLDFLQGIAALANPDWLKKSEKEVSRRPSDQMEVHSEFEPFPQSQPVYRDPNILAGKLDQLNEPGNYQRSFPSRKQYINHTSRMAAANPKAPINCVAVNGWTLGCRTCGTYCDILDEVDGDVVMTNTGAGNVYGCGFGIYRWYHRREDTCRCIIGAGHVPDIGYMTFEDHFIGKPFDN